MVKSCLKTTPPYTPLLDSAAASPSGSGSRSPATCNGQVPALRKYVSFCQDEEYFQADDWDRTPAPVAPKLSYQEILELKQILKSLPRAPSCSSRQPFSTTSIPRSASPPGQSSSTKPVFPISRFATAPSLTPSKWKNRDDSASSVDPQILPYLDSVPIRLLPLLPPSEEPSQPSTPAQCSTSDSSELTETTATPAKPPRPPQSPSASAPPACGVNIASSAAPSNILSFDTTPPASPIPAPQHTPTKRRPNLPNFAFVPLLPVREEFKAPAEIAAPPPPPPARRFNMTFVPLLPPEDLPKVSQESLSDTSSTFDAPAELTPQNETPPEDDLQHSEHDLISSPPSSYMPLNIHRSCMSTPSLCSASDTDTESETPSVSSPCPSSPAESDLAHYFESHATLEPHAEAFDSELHPHNLTSSHNPYFPAIPVCPGLMQNALVEAPVVTKMKLQALPSPALQPPSPLCLDGSEEAEGVALAGAGVVSSGSSARAPTGMAKRLFIQRPSSLSSLSSRTRQQETLNAVSESLSAIATLVTPLPSPAPETPEFTIETMRAPSYVQVPSNWRRVPPLAIENEGILEPSIRRREL
ncbi:uncharacterized protein PHACADRAFT_264657 [Phanerochaete carnosa HHB-10118-sp]|uniref:Uncharacterized protein n=1 Tax=Phanerochaete carnosa (strain HHB-10118-sp) TaxID=650164 RepID=K5VTH9_PHACS|nr:uncharacterized protein PHACADRAFT_264657 [Phanerochaete carnosa HHB-10118-sp]EKM50110.1 hypothetical protein PHACADRAFT_264657 [Phanerochaete carnosa HHB-10118-sp]